MSELSRLSVDSELWKAAYYRAFVLPRASRIPGIRGAATNPNRLHYSSRLSKWLEDSYLIKDGSQTNWKQQYRLRHNWTQGQCAVSEIVVAERPPDPPLLVMMSNSMIYAVDSISGLRAWSSKNDRELLASIALWSEAEPPRLPISMAIDASDKKEGTERVVIGFEDGSFTVYSLKTDQNRFESLFTHPPSTNGMLSALAYSSPYLLTMTEDHLLTLYAFKVPPNTTGTLEAPKLLYSLRSHTAWPPVSLSLRINAASMTAAIAYSLPTYLSGWTVGVQELILSHNGELLESRLAMAADEHSFNLSACLSTLPYSRSSSPFPGSVREPSVLSGPSNSKPTSMSYSHPYLLVAHPDNTLSLYLVRSTSSALSISSGNRLWGHTSSISGAHVGIRGKAVSVSRLGNELRVWDLEGGMNSSANRRRSRNGDLSVRVQPSKYGDEGAQDDVGLRFALEQGFDDSSVSHGWVGFDEQNVIVLRQKSEGSQALVVYDFT
ncbi:f-box domain-containing [Pyrenophora seminiperda CCB06]|uniref:F-box domain-containing n=1 Tax=Pyrenophora seminiperda CCB06 TaxID=1302712 RepID=A0A3M7LXZ6_9PLEO|nr:f-box domain-containing [Pyrenophora seminiperda CCB06]